MASKLGEKTGTKRREREVTIKGNLRGELRVRTLGFRDKDQGAI